MVCWRPDAAAAECGWMTTRFQWLLHRLFRQIWVKSLAYGVLGVATAFLAVLLGPWLPDDLGTRIGADAVDQILGILASSMLAVTTFSVSVMVSAFGTAANAATPRATDLLKQDNTTQRVLASFVGAFLFALVGIIALKAGAYGANGRVVLFVVTIAVLAAVVAALLRWIAHLMNFGRLRDTLDRVEAATEEAFADRLQAPFLGGHPMRGDPPDSAVAVLAEATGYVQHVDLSALNALAEEGGCDLWLAAVPGTFVHPAAPLFHAVGLASEVAGQMRNAFSIGRVRTFDQDPRFGLIALAESASRALSPAVNDPGTAIEVLGRLVRVLSAWTDPVAAEVHWPRLHVPPIRVGELLDDAFRPIARDGAALVEVQIRLQKAFLALAGISPAVFGDAAAVRAADALARAAAAGLQPDEMDTLRQIAAKVGSVRDARGRDPGI